MKNEKKRQVGRDVNAFTKHPSNSLGEGTLLYHMITPRTPIVLFLFNPRLLRYIPPFPLLFSFLVLFLHFPFFFPLPFFFHHGGFGEPFANWAKYRLWGRIGLSGSGGLAD